MKRILSIAAILALSAAIITACKKTDESGTGSGGDVVNGFDKTAMLRQYADSTIIPGYARLEQDLAALATASAGFAASPSQASQSTALQAYAKAYRSYEQVTVFQFGPAETALLDLNLNFSGGLDYNFNTAGSLTGFSVDTAAIDSFVAASALPEFTRIDRNNFYRQGFGALGYLLFSRDAVANQLAAPTARTNYIDAVTKRMSGLVTGVLTGWRGNYCSEFVANTKTNVGSPIGNLVNQFAYQLDILKGPRLGWPAGKQSNGQRFPTKTEAFHAGISVALAAANLKGLKNAYTNGNSGKGIGGYLVALGQQQLNDDVLAQFDVAIAKLEAIPDPLSISLRTNATDVDEAYKEVQKLLTLLKTDVASATAVQITFMDNDGD